jgi:hypothetical protein
MADKKISALTGATTPLDGTEVLPIVQSGSTVKVANNDLRPKQIQSNATSGVLQVAGPAAASTRVMTVPNANFTAARTDAAQSFTGVQTFSTGVVAAKVATSTSSVASTTATPVTLFDTAYAQGRYEIYAFIPQTGGVNSYTAFATVLADDAQARIVANNGILLTITLSGSNVQATQTSGGDQNISYTYTKFI